MTLTIYHNPDCGTSRNSVALLGAAGYAPRVIEYLATPPSPAEILDFARRSGLSVRQLLRRRGTPFAAMGLDDPVLSDAALAAIAHQTPILLNRPIVDDGVRIALCRPSDLVFDVVPAPAPARALLKEDGTAVLRDRAVLASDLPVLAAALQQAGLPHDDLTRAGTSILAFETLAGEPVGFGGYEAYGPVALIRSVVVLPHQRRRGTGRNLALILFRRAFDAGVRDLYLLTNSAAGFFEKLGFARVDRAMAPVAISNTGQFTGACATALLLQRRNEP